jgi:branched-chain amino acid transport system substrate-binding protein
MTRRQYVALALGLVVSTVVHGSAPAQEPVKIGVIQPLSGPVAASGNYIWLGAQIARDAVNARGGVLGRPVQLIIEDNKSDPKESASAAEKLIARDKVSALVGAWGSSMTLAVLPKLEEYGVPMVVETSSAASITKRGNPWVFRIMATSEMEALGMEKYVGAMKIKKADFLAVNTDWGRGAVTAFGDVLKRQGATVGTVEFMDQAATDMNAQLTKIKATGGDTLFITTGPEQLILALKQAQEQRITRTVITTGGSGLPDLMAKGAGQAAEGLYSILFSLPWFPEAMPDPKLAKAFFAEWQKRNYPSEGPADGYKGHDAVLTVVEAIRLAGSTDPKAIQQALWKVDMMGVNGPVKFQKDGPAGKESGQNRTNVYILQVKNGTASLPAFLKQ